MSTEFIGAGLRPDRCMSRSECGRARQSCPEPERLSLLPEVDLRGTAELNVLGMGCDPQLKRILEDRWTARIDDRTLLEAAR